MRRAARGHGKGPTYISSGVTNEKEEMPFQIFQDASHLLHAQGSDLCDSQRRNRPILPWKFTNYEIANHVMFGGHEGQPRCHSFREPSYGLFEVIIRHRMNLTSLTSEDLLAGFPLSFMPHTLVLLFCTAGTSATQIPESPPYGFSFGS